MSIIRFDMPLYMFNESMALLNTNLALLDLDEIKNNLTQDMIDRIKNNTESCRDGMLRYSFVKSDNKNTEDSDLDIVSTTFTNDRIIEFMSATMHFRLMLAYIGVLTKSFSNTTDYATFFDDKRKAYAENLKKERSNRNEWVLKLYKEYLDNDTEFNKLGKKSKQNFCDRYKIGIHTLNYALEYEKEQKGDIKENEQEQENDNKDDK